MNIKKLATAVMVALPIVLLFDGYAATEMVNGITWTYTVSDGTASVGGGSSSSTAVPKSTIGAITIPTTLGGNPVTSIGSSAFSSCSGLTSVTIPDSVTSIGKGAFSGCSGMTSATIPDSVTSIGKGAFSGCSGIVGITLPFVGSKRGNARTADSVLGYIFGEGSYSGGTAITQRFNVLPTNVIISSEPVYTVTYYIPNSLKEVVITDETVLGFGAFSNCKGLTSVTVGKRLSSIGERAFTGCSGLIGITLPFIGNTRGNSETANSLFGYVFGSESYNGGVGVTQYYNPDSSVKYYIPKTLREVTITDETVLGYAAFWGCSGLENIIMPNSITEIGSSAFWGCGKLTSVTIPNKLKNIGDDAFVGCKSLSDVHISDISKWCAVLFGNEYSNPLCYAKNLYVNGELVTELCIPNGVTRINAYAFDGYCKLTSVSIPESVLEIGAFAFRGYDFPAGDDGYKKANGWLLGYSDGASDTISDVDELRGIMGGALEGCTELKSLEFSDKAVISFIGAAALKGCTELQSLVLPPSLKSIGDDAFMGCSYLSNVIVPGSVKSVGARAFKNCTGFTNAQIEYGVESLGEEAFYGDWKINEVDIPSTVKSIGKNAFGGDSSIIRIGVRGDIRTIADIFSNYKLIREATVKEGTGAIVDGLFTNCTQLTDVRFFGNCPALVNNGANLYKGAKSSLKTYVSQDSTGWDGTPGSHQLPQAWPLTGSYRKSIAYWDVPTYLVEFDSNGGTLGVQSTYQYSERLFSLPPEPVQTGYSFAGWWTKPSGGLQVTDNTVFIEGVYRRLYAHWVKGHWVFLDPNGGTVTNNFVTYIEQTVYGVLPAAVRTGYAFGGWRYKGQTVLPTMPISTAADHTLTAQWEAYKYSVKFNANGGEGEMNDLEMTYDEDRALPQNGFRRNGYAFLGWANDGAATGADYADAASVRNLSSEENGVVELFAVWKKDGSNVTLDCIGDAEWAIDQSVVHDGAVAWRSGAIGDDQCSVLRTTVVGKGRVSFYWKVDCEWFRTLRLDSLAFSVDGREIQWINGEKDWMHVEFNIADKGEHVLEWTYAKDGQDDDGDYEDCGWVSEVMWIPVLETLNDYLNCTNLVFETSGDAAWFGQREVSHDGFGALRSGSVGDNRRSCLNATVNGPGVVSFWWKTDCEASYRTYILDHLAFYVDGEEKCFVNGDSGWKHKLVTVGAGQHTISWVYEKDEEGAEGEDCAWLDAVMCIPAGAFPEVVDNSEIVVALAGTVDETKLATHITTKSEYDTFRSWVDSKGLSHDLVKDAPNAWLSYVLDAPGLMAKAAPVASEDVVIESIEPSNATAGAFDLVVNIAGAEIGEGARLPEALGVEGAAELSESAFSSDGLTVSILRTADGKVKAAVTPDGAPPAFFLRVRVR